jgi:hypothetical protein
MAGKKEDKKWVIPYMQLVGLLHREECELFGNILKVASCGLYFGRVGRRVRGGQNEC